MKYAPGLMVGQLSGKAGSTVASRNRNGSYFRTRTIPKLVQNSATAAVRAAFTAYSQAYRNLSEFDQQSWIALGGDLKRKNSLGISYALTGLQAFKSVNQRLNFYGFSPLDTAPALTPASDATAANITVVDNFAVGNTTVTTGATSATQVVGSTTGVEPGDIFRDVTGTFDAVVDHVVDGTHVVLTTSVTTTSADVVDWVRPFQLLANFSPTPIGSGEVLAIEMSAPLSGGVYRPTRSAYRAVTYLPASTSTGHDITADYVAKFGTLSAGQAVFFRVFYVNDSGFAGSPNEGRLAL